MFLSSHLEWISLSSVATQKSLASWKGSSACLHLDRRRGSVPCTLLKWLQVVKIFRWALFLFLYSSSCSSARLLLNTHGTKALATTIHLFLLPRLFFLVRPSSALLMKIAGSSSASVLLLQEHSFLVILGLSTSLLYLQYRFTCSTTVPSHNWRSHLLSLPLLDRRGLYILLWTCKCVSTGIFRKQLIRDGTNLIQYRYRVPILCIW